jgi:zinc transport system substrate-binding protein
MKRNRAFKFAAAPLALAIAAFLPHAAAAELRVVASIAPVHSLVAGVMAGIGEPVLLIPAGISEHTASLRPSQAESLAQASAVFWVGPELEAFLAKPLETLASGAKVVELFEAEGVTKLRLREGEDFEGHEHEGEGDHADAAADDHAGESGEAAEAEHGHDEHGEEYDAHIWLDPVNAQAMLGAIVTTLETLDPDHAAQYRANGEAMSARIEEVSSEIAQQLQPVAGKGFIVFHDAYAYFENRFGLKAAGSIMVNPETMPGAARITEIRKKIGQLGATCVFAEPQYNPAVAAVVIEGTSARTSTLDPIGAAIAPGPDQYPQLLRQLAGSLRDCLGGSS